MTAVFIALCAAFFAGYLLRSRMAKLERDCWHASLTETRRRLRASWEQLKAARQQHAYELETANSLSDQLGEDVWLLDGLARVHGLMLRGERPEGLSIQVHWKATDTTVIGIGRGDLVAERVAMVPYTDGYSCWQQPQDIDLPEPGSPRWGTC